VYQALSSFRCTSTRRPKRADKDRPAQRRFEQISGCRHLFGGVTCRGKSLGEDVELILTFFNYCSSNAPRAIGIKGIGNP